MSKPKAIFSWSGGKDSAYCLHKVLKENLFNVVYLLTTMNEKFKRVSMHGICEELLDRQAEAIDIPLLKVKVNKDTNEEYEKKMEEILLKAKSEGIQNVIFGDIFLEDLKTYREKNLAKIGMKGIFPLWEMNTEILLDDFIIMGFKSKICCTNDTLGAEWLGREINATLKTDLPENIDLCGENGAYHSFCYEGPIFKNKISFEIGETIFKPITNKIKPDNELQTSEIEKGFWFCDFIPG